MKRWDLISNANRLQKATRELEMAWQEAQIAWDDPASRAFAEKFLQPMTPKLRLVLSATAELDQVITQGYRACSDEARDG